MPETVCWICGFSAEERAKQEGRPGECPIPREVGKDPRRCLLNGSPEIEMDPAEAQRFARWRMGGEDG